MDYTIEKLSENHTQYYDSLINTYKNISEIGAISENEMKEILTEMKSQGTVTYIALSKENGIIGLCTLLLEKKFQRKGSYAGHIEDVVVRKGFEGIGIASKLMKKCMQYAEQKKCYKVILDCDSKLIGFYERFGFEEDGVFMRKYLLFK